MNCTERTYLDKLERVLYFVRTFDELGIELKKLPNRSKELMITDNIMISEPFYDAQTRILLYCSEKDPDSGVSIDHVVKTYPMNYKASDDGDELEDSFFNDDYYSNFLLFNSNTDFVDFTTGYGHEVHIDIPDLDLQTEDGLFQFQTLHPDQIVDIMKIVQYFQRKGHPSFADWFHPEFDKIYEELNDTFNIGRENYLPSN